MTMTRDRLLSLASQTTTVTIQGEAYLIRELTGADLDALRDKRGGVDERGIMARIACLGLCDEDGKPLFNIRTDIEKLNALPVSLLKAISQAVSEHSGLVAEDTDDLVGK